MKRLSVLGLAAVAVIGLLAGCATSPEPGGQTSYAYAVGDRTRVDLDEIVVSLPLSGAPTSYQNLHVCLAATVNPAKPTLYKPYTVADIFQRLQARIAAREVESLAKLKTQSLDDMPVLREQVAHVAQAVVDEAMEQWEHGSEYEVKVLVVSLYWTDASVGRAPKINRWGWW